MKSKNITNTDILKAVQKRRQETGGSVGPSLRQLEDTLGLSFSTVQARVQVLIEIGQLSCVWIPHGDKVRAAPFSLALTEAGLKLLEGDSDQPAGD